MLNSEPLVPLGLAVIALTACLIGNPYLRGKSDALTSWNLVLLGGAIFVGVGCLEVAYGVFHWTEFQWFQPTKRDIHKFMLGTLVFYATLLFTYYVLKWPRKLVARFFNKWPQQSTNWEFFVLALCLGLTVLSLLFKGVPILGAPFGNVSHKADLFASVISFSYWYRNKVNLAALLLFLGIFGYALLFCMVAFIVRRLLLSMGIVPLVSMYWLQWRYRSPKSNLVRLGIAALIAFSITAFYSTIRHASLGPGAPERSFSSIVREIEGSSLKKSIAAVTQDWMHYLSPYAVHYSLLTIHLVDDGQVKVEPLNPLAFVATYPIPRIIFPTKPSLLGIRIVTDVLRLPYPTNWGLGIVGHGYHEGGIPVIILYAVLLVIMARLLDDAMARQPSNVYLIAVLCVTAPHFVTLIRGDPANMTAEILEGFFFAWGLALMGRFFVGTSPETNNSRQSGNIPAQLGSLVWHLRR